MGKYIPERGVGIAEGAQPRIFQLLSSPYTIDRVALVTKLVLMSRNRRREVEECSIGIKYKRLYSSVASCHLNVFLLLQQLRTAITQRDLTRVHEMVSRRFAYFLHLRGPCNICRQHHCHNKHNRKWNQDSLYLHLSHR